MALPTTAWVSFTRTGLPPRIANWTTAIARKKAAIPPITPLTLK